LSMYDASSLLVQMEVGGETVCVVVGIAAFLVSWRAAPAPSLRLHSHARRFFLAALGLFVLAETFSLLEVVLDLEDHDVLFAGLLTVAHEGFQVGFVGCLGTGAWYMMKAEPEEVQALRRFAEEDSLTSLHNRHYLDVTIQGMAEFSKKHGLPLCCLMMDVDDFKLYNDALGHAEGDVVLTGVADVLRKATRPTDAVVRYGGEEFIVVTICSLEEASVLAERLRAEVETRFATAGEDRRSPAVTVSLGVATLTEDMEGIRRTIEAADKELYRAKRNGKNCVCVVDGDSLGNLDR
jgi:diguanylate cyclase (GGDEF)-like protein